MNDKNKQKWGTRFPFNSISVYCTIFEFARTGNDKNILIQIYSGLAHFQSMQLRLNRCWLTALLHSSAHNGHSLQMQANILFQYDNWEYNINMQNNLFIAVNTNCELCDMRHKCFVLISLSFEHSRWCDCNFAKTLNHFRCPMIFDRKNTESCMKDSLCPLNNLVASGLIRNSRKIGAFNASRS